MNMMTQGEMGSVWAVISARRAGLGWWVCWWLLMSVIVGSSFGIFCGGPWRCLLLGRVGGVRGDGVVAG